MLNHNYREIDTLRIAQKIKKPRLTSNGLLELSSNIEMAKSFFNIATMYIFLIVLTYIIMFHHFLFATWLQQSIYVTSMSLCSQRQCWVTPSSQLTNLKYKF